MSQRKRSRQECFSRYLNSDIGLGYLLEWSIFNRGSDVQNRKRSDCEGVKILSTLFYKHRAVQTYSICKAVSLYSKWKQGLPYVAQSHEEISLLLHTCYNVDRRNT